MEFLIVLFIIAAVVLPLLGWLVWIVFFVWLAKLGLGAAERQMNAVLRNLEPALRQASENGIDQLDAGTQAQIMSMLMQARTQMSQMDDLSRQRYDARMGDLMGMAASAGIDWSP